MNNTVTSFDTRWATFNTIARPTEISSLNDLYDFRILMRRPRDNCNIDLFFQVEMHRDIVREETRTQQMLQTLYGAIMEHIRTELTKGYGPMELRTPREGRMTEERRLNIELDRIFVREPVQMTFISDVTSSRNINDANGEFTVVVRLPRGFTIKCLPAHLPQDMEKSSGTVRLFDKDFVFYLHRPPMTESVLVNQDVVAREFREKLTKTFPFGDFSEAQLNFK